MRCKMLAVATMVVVAANLIIPTHGKADDEGESRIKRGFEIAPVKLNLESLTDSFIGG